MINKSKFNIKKLSNILFFGESPYLEKLIEINKKHGIKTHVITSKSQSKSISKRIKYNIYNNLNKKFENFIKKNFNTNNTLFISLGARYIFNKHLINVIFKKKLINFHDSRLPYDAGGGDFTWKILREDRIDNQLVHLIDSGVDSGPILDSAASIVPSYCKTPKDYEEYKSIKFVEFYNQFVKKLILSKSFKLQYQPKNIGRYNPRLNTRINGFINWDMDSHEIYNFINAFDEPFLGASSFLNNGKFGRLHIKNVHLHGGDTSNHPYMSGIVSRHDGNWIVVSTRNKHMLLIESVLDKKGKNIINKIKVGDRFYTPSKYLDKSKSKRIIYNTYGLKRNK